MTLLLVLVAFVFFIFGFSVYAKMLERLFLVDETRSTPSMLDADGIDKVPTKWPVLFGHHFASIAGAAPIIGPVLAISLWGWVPVYWWIILGAVFIGGLHDFGSLMLSLRYNGISIGQIAEKLLSSRARLVFSVFLWFALILVIAVFASVTAKTFIKSPEIVLPSFGLIFIAVLVGFLLNNKKKSLLFVTLLGLFLLSILMILGKFFPLRVTGDHVNSVWVCILMIYSFIASITPVQYLLQPRDYISSYLLFLGLIVGYLGLFLSHPNINFPQHTMSSPLGFWPMLFVVVACGAVSGFHSLIATGTTVRQIANERHARYVAYGSMLAEAALAILAVFAIIAGFSSPKDFAYVLKNQGPIGAFSVGFGHLTKEILGQWGRIFAVIMLNAFVLTTLDTATRIGRYITEELLNLSNRWISSLIVVLPATALAISGQWKRVWPLFGAANQLISAMVLLMLGLFLFLNKRPYIFVFIVAFLMYVTICSALYLKNVEFFDKNHLLWIIALVLLALSIFILIEIITKIASISKNKQRIKSKN